MRDSMGIRVPKWPFFLGDASMFGLAGFIYWQGTGPLAHWDIIAMSICVGLGALLGLLPFLLEYRGLLQLIQIGTLGAVSEKIANLERLAAQISGATNQWEMAQQYAEKTTATAREISERMASEVRDFNEFMQKMDSGEKAALRLESEKLRRGEAEWLQIVVRMLDHIFALHAAARRSGQAGLIEQLTHFQNACRDTARRVGLVPFVAEPAEPFDPQRHQWADGEKAPEAATVTETLATGFTFQSRLVRPALVRIQAVEAVVAGMAGEVAPPPAPPTEQDQLPLTPA